MMFSRAEPDFPQGVPLQSQVLGLQMTPQNSKTVIHGNFSLKFKLVSEKLAPIWGVMIKESHMSHVTQKQY